MSNKAKGSKAERELYSMFIDNSFRAVRVAGSGTMENADCDLIAGKPGKKYCIEIKSTKQSSKYITKEQINSFIVFSEIFGLKPVIAVRFNRIGWFFFDPTDLEDSGKNWVINQETARTKGKRFGQFFGEIEIKKNKIKKVKVKTIPIDAKKMNYSEIAEAIKEESDQHKILDELQIEEGIFEEKNNEEL